MAPRVVFQCLELPGTLRRESFEEFLESMHPMFQRKNELRAEQSRALWDPTIRVGKAQQTEAFRTLKGFGAL